MGTKIIFYGEVVQPCPPHPTIYRRSRRASPPEILNTPPDTSQHCKTTYTGLCTTQSACSLSQLLIGTHFACPCMDGSGWVHLITVTSPLITSAKHGVLLLSALFFLSVGLPVCLSVRRIAHKVVLLYALVYRTQFINAANIKMFLL